MKSTVSNLLKTVSVITLFFFMPSSIIPPHAFANVDGMMSLMEEQHLQKTAMPEDTVEQDSLSDGAGMPADDYANSLENTALSPADSSTSAVMNEESGDLPASGAEEGPLDSGTADTAAEPPAEYEVPENSDSVNNTDTAPALPEEITDSTETPAPTYVPPYTKPAPYLTTAAQTAYSSYISPATGTGTTTAAAPITSSGSVTAGTFQSTSYGTYAPLPYDFYPVEPEDKREEVIYSEWELIRNNEKGTHGYISTEFRFVYKVFNEQTQTCYPYDFRCLGYQYYPGAGTTGWSPNKNMNFEYGTQTQWGQPMDNYYNYRAGQLVSRTEKTDPKEGAYVEYVYKVELFTELPKDTVHYFNHSFGGKTWKAKVYPDQKWTPSEADVPPALSADPTVSRQGDGSYRGGAWTSRVPNSNYETRFKLYNQATGALVKEGAAAYTPPTAYAWADLGQLDGPIPVQYRLTMYFVDKRDGREFGHRSGTFTSQAPITASVDVNVVNGNQINFRLNSDAPQNLTRGSLVIRNAQGQSMTFNMDAIAGGGGFEKLVSSFGYYGPFKYGETYTYTVYLQDTNSTTLKQFTGSVRIPNVTDISISEVKVTEASVDSLKVEVSLANPNPGYAYSGSVTIKGLSPQNGGLAFPKTLNLQCSGSLCSALLVFPAFLAGGNYSITLSGQFFHSQTFQKVGEISERTIQFYARPAAMKTFNVRNSLDYANAQRNAKAGDEVVFYGSVQALGPNNTFAGGVTLRGASSGASVSYGSYVPEFLKDTKVENLIISGISGHEIKVHEGVKISNSVFNISLRAIGNNISIRDSEIRAGGTVLKVEGSRITVENSLLVSTHFSGGYQAGDNYIFMEMNSWPMKQFQGVVGISGSIQNFTSNNNTVASLWGGQPSPVSYSYNSYHSAENGAYAFVFRPGAASQGHSINGTAMLAWAYDRTKWEPVLRDIAYMSSYGSAFPAPAGKVSVTYSNIDKSRLSPHVLDAQGNIDTNGKSFMYTVDNDFSPKQGNPLIDQGFPDRKDPDGTRDDIGLRYYNKLEEIPTYPSVDVNGYDTFITSSEAAFLQKLSQLGVTGVPLAQLKKPPFNETQQYTHRYVVAKNSAGDVVVLISIDMVMTGIASSSNVWYKPAGAAAVILPQIHPAKKDGFQIAFTSTGQAVLNLEGSYFKILGRKPTGVYGHTAWAKDINFSAAALNNLRPLAKIKGTLPNAGPVYMLELLSFSGSRSLIWLNSGKNFKSVYSGDQDPQIVAVSANGDHFLFGPNPLTKQRDYFEYSSGLNYNIEGFTVSTGAKKTFSFNLTQFQIHDMSELVSQIRFTSQNTFEVVITKRNMRWPIEIFTGTF